MSKFFPKNFSRLPVNPKFSPLFLVKLLPLRLYFRHVRQLWCPHKQGTHERNTSNRDGGHKDSMQGVDVDVDDLRSDVCGEEVDCEVGLIGTVLYSLGLIGAYVGKILAIVINFIDWEEGRRCGRDKIENIP